LNPVSSLPSALSTVLITFTVQPPRSLIYAWKI
jgi:hypothetical protein